MKITTHPKRGTTTLAILVLCLLGMPGPAAAEQTGRSNAVRQSDVIYGRRSGLALTMEVFTPARRNGIGVVWVVSSSGRSSREQTLQDSFERRIAPLLERGYTVFAVIHGSAPIFNLQDHVADVRRAIRFVRHRASEFAIDGQRLGIAGSSAGGLLALIVAMQGQDGDAASGDGVERESSHVQAVGCFFPPTDLLNYGESGVDLVGLMQKRDGKVDPTFQFFHVDARTGVRSPVTRREEVLQMLRDYSPVTHVAAGDPPTILVHGDQDKAVPIQQSHRLVDRLQDANVPVRLVVREGAGHAYVGWEADSASIADWFDTYLRRVP